MQCTGPHALEGTYFLRHPAGHLVPEKDLLDLPFTQVTDDVFFAVAALVGLYDGFFVFFNFVLE